MATPGANVISAYTAIQIGVNTNTRCLHCDVTGVLDSPAMPRSALKTPSSAKPATAPRKTYHHGNLRQAMIEATVRLVEEGGPEKVTVREAARRAGVSSGAPFRHFPNKMALMTAVAEEAMQRFRDEIEAAQAKVKNADPMTRFSAIGDAYLRWVIRNPTHFRVISERQQIDFAGSDPLQRHNAEIQALMGGLLTEARGLGMLRPGDIKHVQLASRAIAYGLARMYIDGHLPQWGVANHEARRHMAAVFDLFLGILRSDAPPKPRPRRSRQTAKDTC